MNRILSRRPSPALVISILALVVAMAGTAFAATQLPKNSVGSKQIKKKAVTAAKIKKNAITTAKVKKEAITSAKIKLSTLKTVPSAQVANTLAPMEATHLIGAPGEPGFESGSTPVPAGELNLVPPGFFKDHSGVVHLEGIALAGEGEPFPGAVFRLPAGFRPPAGQIVLVNSGENPLLIVGSNVVVGGKDISGLVATTPGDPAFLNTISFRAAS